MKKIFALLIALTMLFALVSCGEESSSETSASESASASESGSTESEVPVDESEPVVFGHIADLTGNEASTGTLASKALQFAVDYFNENGGVKGHKIEIAEQDAKSDSATAKDVAKTLVESNKAAVILGPTQIGHKSAVAEYVSEAKVPAVYYNGTPSGAISNNEYVIGLGGSTDQMPTAMAAYLYDDLGYQSIVVITQDNTGGDNYLNPLQDEFINLGGEVISDLRVPSDATDTSTYMMQASGAGADCIVAWLSGSQAISLWGQWFEQGVSQNTPMEAAVHGGFTDYFIWNAVSGSHGEELADAMETWGIYAPITYAYSVDNDENAKLLEFYKTYDWGDEASTYGSVPVGSNMFGAVWSAVEAVVDTMNTLDDPNDSEALYEALQGIDMETPEGNLVIDSTRIATKDIHIVQVVKLEDGSFNYDVVKTYNNVPPEGYTG